MKVQEEIRNNIPDELFLYLIFYQFYFGFPTILYCI